MRLGIGDYFRVQNHLEDDEDVDRRDQIRDDINRFTTIEEKYEFLRERREGPNGPENREEDHKLFEIPVSGELPAEIEDKDRDEDEEASKNGAFVGRSSTLLISKPALKYGGIGAGLATLTFLIVLLVVFISGTVGVGHSPFEFCGKPVAKPPVSGGGEATEDKYKDAYAFGEYLKASMPELTNEQIYGLLGNVAVESSEMGTRAFQSYYIYSEAEREEMLKKDNQWWLDWSAGMSARAVGLIQWDPASKLINIAVEQGVHWTDSQFQFGQALSYFQGRGQWDDFLVPGQTTAYYAEVGMRMEGCQIGAHGCTPEERATSAEQFVGHDFTGDGAAVGPNPGNLCTGDTTTSGQGWTDPFLGHITDNFGPRESICGPQGCSSSYHRGTDLAKSGGTCDAEIYAANAGEVIWAAYNGGEGNSVHIQHPDGIVTKYFHMPYENGIVVKVGDQVKAGQLIGHAGDTGASFGCHLHFEVHVMGEAIDSVPFLLAAGVNIDAN